MVSPISPTPPRLLPSDFNGSEFSVYFNRFSAFMLLYAVVFLSSYSVAPSAQPTRLSLIRYLELYRDVGQIGSILLHPYSVSMETQESLQQGIIRRRLSGGLSITGTGCGVFQG